MKRRIAPVLIAIAALSLPASAIALPGPQGRLTQLSGLDGCVSGDGSDMNGNFGICEEGNSYINAFNLAVAPDSDDVYVAAAGVGVEVLNRDAGTGDLDAPGANPCVGAAGFGCTAFLPGQNVRSVAVSPDGEHVYAVSSSVGTADAVVALKRNANGSLTPLGDVIGGGRASDCIGLMPAGDTVGCVDGRGMDDPRDIAVSADGKHVYVASQANGSTGAGTVTAFSRDTSGVNFGKLAQLTGEDGCISSDGDADDAVNCANTPEGGFNLNNAQALDISDDGNHVYVAAQSGNGVTAFSRNSTSGALTQIQCALGAADGVCTSNAKGVAGAADIDVAPDGKHVYVVSSTQDALATLTRTPATGLLTVPSDCVSEGAQGAGCSTETARALDGADGVAVSPDNRSVYVASTNSNAVATFSRNISTGVPTQLSGAGGCTADQPGTPAGTTTCTDGRALIGAAGLALSPNSVHLYAASGTSRSVTAFARQLPPQCVGGAVPGTIGPETRTIQLNCPDPNGDPIAGYFTTGVTHGTLGGLNIPAGTIQYTAEPNYDGPDQILVNAQDNAPEPGQGVIMNLDVDTVAPAVAISFGPADPTTSTQPTFGFDSEDGATFECRLDGAPFAACDDATGPAGSHTAPAPLAVGGHVFEVRATDAVGNAGAKATQAFSVIAASTPPPEDTDPPETTVTKTKVKDDVATIKFTSDEAGSTFQCRIDKKPLKPCTSPKKFKNLDDGKHKVFVQATDAAGNTDASAAKSKFEVES